MSHASAPAVTAAPRTKRHGFRDDLLLNLRAARARAYVRIVGSSREISWVVSDAVFPTLGMVAFVLLYRALGAPKSFETLAVLGGVLATYWINVLWGMAAQFYWEKQQGQLQLYFVAPCSRMSILTGMAVGGVFMTTTRTLFTFAVGFGVLGIRIPPFDVGALVGVFLITMTALYALGMTLASLFLLHGREAWHLCNAMLEPVYFLSGLYFPLRTLGALGGLAAGLIPLALGVDALRQIMLKGDAHGLMPVGLETAILSVLAVVFFACARLSLRYLENLSKREGRLTQRWQ
jgi:ABC-2 type transport system permease protein